MTNLMHQLQAWADEGRYTFPLTEGGKRGFDRKGLTHLLTADEQYGVGYVLDGTIQVWRPVEHYAPPENTEVLALFLVSENAGYEHGIVETNVEKGFTHWQPLPQPPQEVSHAVS